MKSKILVLSLTIAASISARAIDITTFGSTYNQNFDTLANTGTSSTLPPGWAFSESLANANTTYTAGTGGTAGDTYSFGSAASTDRALGGLQSTFLLPVFGVQFQNLTGGIITSLSIGYTGEQWRLGTTGRSDRLDFQYSLDATSLINGTWTDFNTLDFSTPNSGGAPGPYDGNAAANRTLISSTISAISIGSGTTFWLRWNDFNATGADDGLAVDDFSLTANGVPSSVPDSLPASFTAVIFFLIIGLSYRFRRQTIKA